jgi:hypothetical protein
MDVEIEKKLKFAMSRLENEQETGNRPVIVAVYASVLARCYRAMGGDEQAKTYFQLSAEKHLLALPERISRTSSPLDRGDELFNVGRALWWAQDPRAGEYFQQALDAFLEADQLPGLEARIRSWVMRSVVLILLEDAPRAHEAVVREVELSELSTVPRAGPPLSPVLMEIAERCVEATPEAYLEAFGKLEGYRKATREGLYGMNPTFIIDLHQFLQRKLTALQSGQGE